LFEQVKKQSLSNAVFEQLRDRIVRGEMEVGDPLPAERVLAEKLGVNRSAVREGLKRLEQAGLVAIQQGGKTKVLNFKKTGGLELLAAMMVKEGGLINTGVARSVLEMRNTLAPDAARLCAKRCNDETASQLDDIVTEMHNYRQDLSMLQKLALVFWQTIIQGSDNVGYQLAFNSLDMTYGQVLEHFTLVLQEEFESIELYQNILNSISHGDGEKAFQESKQLVAKGAQAMESVLAEIDKAQTQEVPRATGGR
tara:strand:+ start:1074 stop:1832 length:759 start_codon:yes stop_codon:yes gene_type:complete